MEVTLISFHFVFLYLLFFEAGLWTAAAWVPHLLRRGQARGSPAFQLARAAATRPAPDAAGVGEGGLPHVYKRCDDTPRGMYC